MLVGKTYRLAVTIRQRLGFTTLTAAIDGAHCVDYMFCCQPSACSDDRLPGGQRSDLADDLTALGEDCRSPGAMDRSVDSASAQKRRIRRIHHRVGGLFCDVGRTVDFNSFAAIEQKPNCEGLHSSVQDGHFLSVSASTPGSFFPSRNSSDAPPPVEM